MSKDFCISSKVSLIVCGLSVHFWINVSKSKSNPVFDLSPISPGVVLCTAIEAPRGLFPVNILRWPDGPSYLGAPMSFCFDLLCNLSLGERKEIQKRWLRYLHA
ncbi:unnamed protein product [Brugia timori]|uniref:Secreted protein n=1 Tax=Brugia timori TaxID=42155 RepID=A0A0R3QB88_9BILA|nr:unnamed protein product [Brugia timori]